MALAVVLAFSANSYSQTPVTLNFVDADIDVVAKAVGELTGKTFVLDPRVKGKINIQSAKGVAPGLAYPTFLSALRMAGFAAVEGPGGIVVWYLKLMPRRCPRRWRVSAVRTAATVAQLQLR